MVHLGEPGSRFCVALVCLGEQFFAYANLFTFEKVDLRLSKPEKSYCKLLGDFLWLVQEPVWGCLCGLFLWALYMP